MSWVVERPTTTTMASSAREESRRQRSHGSTAFHAKSLVLGVEEVADSKQGGETRVPCVGISAAYF